jgi:hypothetical protein
MESFASALNRFLRTTGRWNGMTRWFDEVIEIDPRYLRRWRNQGMLPSLHVWEHFEIQAKQDFKGNPEKLKALEDLKVVWQYHHDLNSSARSDSDEVYQPAWRKHGPGPQSRSTAVPTSETLLARFIADTRIAAQLKTKTGSKAVYLDKVYVHRSEPEKRVFQSVRNYLSEGKEAQGSWISVVGDAGHGKTSFLWCVVQECGRLCPRLFPVQALQLSSNALRDYAESIARTGTPFLFVLDTLDLLVGIDDEWLSGVLNSFRANGGLVITTCRKQEIKTLASKVRANQTVDLERYDPDEAKAAIERYVDAFYADWPEQRRQAQIDHVWNLLDAQRKIQDLNFEPLLLRMIFEAYAPDDIPPDINTQKVYDHFWEERVLGDRAAKDHEDAHARATLCLRLASYLYFETNGHTERASVADFVEQCQARGIPDAIPILHSLVSSGVLRWWQLRASVGFFHQTFLEYAAAKSLLESFDDASQSERIAYLLSALKRADLFRVPVLKQLLIQSSNEDSGLFNHLCAAVAEVNTTVAAGLLLEVLGKARNVSSLREQMLDWNTREPHLIRIVATEVLRYFPAKRVRLALEILDSHMNGERLGEICSVCDTYFAPMDPEGTIRFLRESWRRNPRAFKGFEAALKMALVAVFRAGCVDALDALVEILPTLSVGIQAGALDDLSELWTTETASEAVTFLERLFPVFVASDENEPRSGFVKAFAALNAAAPDATRALAKTLASRAGASPNGKALMLLARVVGIADPSTEVIGNAFADLSSADHLRRVAASYLLREAARKRSDVMDRLLALPQETEPAEETLSVIATVASGSQDAAKLLAVLERWDLTERGSGNAFRLLMVNAAKVDPHRTLDWLKRRMPIARNHFHKRQILVGFQVVVENAAKTVSKEDAHLFWEFGFRDPTATDEMRRVIAAAAGWMAEIDEALGREVFRRVFKKRNRGPINAAIGSLRYTGSPELVVFVFGLMRSFSADQEGHATFGQFLEAICERNPEVRDAVMRELNAPPSRTLIQRLNSPVVVGRVFALLKGTVKADTTLVLELAALCPLINDGNLASLSAVLENASHQTASQDVARSILARLLELGSNPSFRVGNSLRKALPRLDRILPHREVADAVLKTILTSLEWPEKSLEQLVRAAKAMESWTQADEEAVHRSELPHRVKAALLS